MQLSELNNELTGILEAHTAHWSTNVRVRVTVGGQTVELDITEINVSGAAVRDVVYLETK